MNASKLALSGGLFLAVCVTFALLSFRSPAPAKAKPEMQTCYGPSITTQNLHNAVMGQYDPNVYRQFANAWFRNYTLSVSVGSGWHFTGEPYVNCVRDDQGAFGWNNFPGAHDRFFVTERTPNRIVCTCWAGSRSMIINLACVATKD